MSEPATLQFPIPNFYVSAGHETLTDPGAEKAVIFMTLVKLPPMPNMMSHLLYFFSQTI